MNDIKKQKIITVHCDKLVFGGQALGYGDHHAVFVWNALPHEIVKARVFRKKKGYVEAVAEKIIEESPVRMNPQEGHYLSCSPWQIMPCAYENEWKRNITVETYARLAGIVFPELPLMVHTEKIYGYRNKIEYSFTHNEKKMLSLAFYERGTHKKTPITECILARPTMNVAAHDVCSWLAEDKFPLRSLKSMVVRTNEKGETLVGLFVKDKLSLVKKPPLNNHIQGFQLYYSSPKCPASRADEEIIRVGNETLTENVFGALLSYGIHSFFQVNVALFEKVLEALIPFLDKKRKLIDFYSGVGAMSIPLKEHCRECLLIENNSEAVFYAQKNIVDNQCVQYTVRELSTEKALDAITDDAFILFDPPRSGLHPKVIKQLKKVKPPRILYVSCNIATQARDIGELIHEYDVIFMKLFNFFPRTPHIEGLCVLDLKA